MHTLAFEAHPAQLAVLLFTGVANAADIRTALVAKALQPEAAFFNAALVPDLFALHLAAHKALTDQVRRGEARGRRRVHSSACPD